MSTAARLGLVAAGIAAGAALITYYIVSFLMVTPPVVAATGSAPQVSLTLQTVAAYGHPPHPDWVSYLAENPQGKWVHSTVLRVPANSTVNVTIYQFDTATGLRNPFWGQPRGTLGGTMNVDGKSLTVLNPDLASHTFAIPELGVSVPLEGISSKAKNPCSAAPCPLSTSHTTVKFSFKTGKPGKYRWQCFVPCAFKFPLGFGGPMQSLGWMDGYLEVVS
jgi:hypothetical protein